MEKMCTKNDFFLTMKMFLPKILESILDISLVTVHG